MEPQELKRGQLVQLDPMTVNNQAFAWCVMVVTEPKPWGAQGYVQSLGVNGKAGGQSYYRAEWEEMELVGEVKWISGKW